MISETRLEEIKRLQHEIFVRRIRLEELLAGTGVNVFWGAGAPASCRCRRCLAEPPEAA